MTRLSKRPVVSIVVITVNTPAVTQACIKSILHHTTVPYELIVVNNSRARAIRKRLKTFCGIKIIPNKKNLGYARAANQGAAASRGKFICFLNSDTLVPPHWMERLLKAAKLPKVGAVSPLSEWETYRRLGPSKIQNAMTFTQLTDLAFQKWYKNRLKKARWLSGFCLMIPKAVMLWHGFFDEQFFFGWEDIDYSLRLRLEGYKLLKVESLFIYHRRGASSSVKRHKLLVRRAEKAFLSKWSLKFNKKFSKDRDVFAEVDRREKLSSFVPIPLSAWQQ